MNAHRIIVRKVELTSPKLDHSVRLAQVSDIHVGSRGPGFLPRIVRLVNALEPDAILVTGDLIDLMGLPAGATDSIGALNAPAFFVIGNHERYIGSDEVCARLEALGVTVLRNACADRGTLRIIGIDDAEAATRSSANSARIGAGDHCPSAFTILMYHRPDGVEDAARAGVDLMLCGHTHNGQITPFNWVVKRFFPRIAGRFDIDGMVLHVLPGTGTGDPRCAWALQTRLRCSSSRPLRHVHSNDPAWVTSQLSALHCQPQHVSRESGICSRRHRDVRASRHREGGRMHTADGHRKSACRVATDERA